MFFVVFLACQEHSALQGVGYGHEVQEDRPKLSSSNESNGIDASGFEFLPEELEVSLKVNAYRQQIGLPPMTLVEDFSQLARLHSVAMADGELELGHDGYEDRFQLATSVAYLNRGGENVGMNFGVPEPVVRILNGWIDSPDHLENMAGNYNLTGVGIAVSEEGAYFFTQLFFNGELY